MSLSTYYLEDGRHLVRLHRCCRHHRCAYTPTSNTALAMITTRKSIHGFPLVSYMGIRFNAVCIYGACLKCLLPEPSIPAAGQKDRWLWGREWCKPGQTTTTSCNIHQCCMKHLTSFKFDPSCRNMSQLVATGWPNAPNMLHPTMLRYVAVKCCDRLAGGLKH